MVYEIKRLSSNPLTEESAAAKRRGTDQTSRFKGGFAETPQGFGLRLSSGAFLVECLSSDMDHCNRDLLSKPLTQCETIRG